ncbi:type I restriction endonuclease subunit S [Acetobacterium fimetarium]|uniref:Type I restriction endonuclease subunit S n=1 Tax=Acetobacterium fimetarium TaxID=52691 RepID=A0ABR6WU87_9FIRM|nr:restriction endonuclease subunit S [Acetobacterium fimetarium]MBC3804120.1 type I restriction endonuclease subunit S [Acetobacterium fimetarium]
MGKWEKVRLGDVGSYVNGFAFKPEDWSSQGLPIIRIQNLTESRNEVNYYAKSDKNKYEINDGDVLISWSASLGVYQWSKGRALLNQHIFKVVFDKLEINKKYFIHVITHLLKDMSKETHGSTMKHITKSRFDNMQIPLPHLEIQQKIAATLDTAATLLKLRQQQLAELEALIQSVFYQMFGDPVRNEKGWESGTLSKHLSIVAGYAFKSTGFIEKGIPVLKIGNINTGVFKKLNLVYWEEDTALKRYLLYPGDLVISLTGTVGKDDYANVCILGGDFECYYLNQRNAKLVLGKSLDKFYLSYYFKDPAIKGKLTGISRGIRQANISNSDILSLKILLPPLSLQNQFAAIVQKIDQQKALVQQSIDETQTLFDSLMSQYFD